MLYELLEKPKLIRLDPELLKFVVKPTPDSQMNSQLSISLSSKGGVSGSRKWKEHFS